MKKILVVEDVDFNRDLLVQLLEDDYEVIEAVNGQEGVELAEREAAHTELLEPVFARFGEDELRAAVVIDVHLSFNEFLSFEGIENAGDA